MNTETLYDVMYRSNPRPLGDYESSFDSREEFEEWVFEEFAKNYDDSYINLPVCEMCDYKGEGVGSLQLFETVKHLPVYKPNLSSYSLE